MKNALSESQKGRAVEQLVAALLILQSKGALRVAVPCVDDEGVDLVVGHRTTGRTLLLQIKSRFTLSGRGHYRADVRRATCSPDPNKLLLFVYYDEQRAGLGETCWLINSQEFCTRLTRQKPGRKVYVFASTFRSRADMWAPFRLSVAEVAARIADVLDVSDVRGGR
jgi:hypothetical protein